MPHQHRAVDAARRARQRRRLDPRRRGPFTRDGGDELSFHIDEDAEPTGGEDTVPAFSLDTLLARHTGPVVVDYVKMDIEGAEQRVLREHTDWTRHVRSIKVEVHELLRRRRVRRRPAQTRLPRLARPQAHRQNRQAAA